jgi:glycosyltransferase involved in cell wall biosynthesis
MAARRTILVLGSLGASIPSFRGPLIRAMLARGHRVEVAADFASPEEKSAVERLGAVVHQVATERHGMNPLGEIDYARRLRRLLDAVSPDTLLAYTAKPVAWGVPAARAAGVERVVALVTGLGFAFIEGGGLRRRLARASLERLYRRSFARCSAVVFQNPDDRSEFLRRGLLSRDVPSVVVGGSGIDLDAFPAAPVPPAPSFLMIARLLGDKGVREYAAASAALARRHASARFRLAGWTEDGPDAVSQGEVRRWAALGVEILGRLDDVRPALADCSCYVLPSYREGTPRTVLEAMSTGRAIVTTDVPGCRQTVEDGCNGVLVPPRDPTALAAAMERFVLDPHLAVGMGAASRRLAEERFDVHRVNRAMLPWLGVEP